MSDDEADVEEKKAAGVEPSNVKVSVRRSKSGTGRSARNPRQSNCLTARCCVQARA